MTNEEAVKIIEDMRNNAINLILEKAQIDAIDLAINALGAIDQIKWERDIAIEQLKDLGYSLGEKPRTDGDLLSRQQAIDDAKSWVGMNWYEKNLQRNVIEWLKELPSAEPELSQVARDIATIIENEKDMRVISERKTGRWIPMEVSSGSDSWKCSVCGRRARGKLENLPYCHCGAKMLTYTGAKMEVEHGKTN